MNLEDGQRVNRPIGLLAVTHYAASVAAFDTSPVTLALARLIDAVGPDRAHEELDRIRSDLSVVERAAVAYAWPRWARPKQLPPDTDWQSWGKLEGRGTGKTLGNSKFVNEEVEAGRARLVCLMAQDEDNAIKLQVTGPSGLIATAKPWFRPEWHVSDLELIWPNGAKAYVRTPEVPGKIRGLEYHLSWICELQSWPAVTRDEAYMNVLLATRLGYARIIWDATAKRRHPLLRKLLKQSAADPARFVVTSGSTHENRLNLGAGYIEKLEAEMGGTQQGEEELHGRMSADAEGALVDETSIARNRRTVMGPVLRRIICLDPATTSRAGSDNTGLVDMALSTDKKALVLGDHTGKHAPEVWGGKALDLYVDGRCDLIVVETNKGGDLCTRNLRACAAERGLVVVVIGKEERAPGHMHGVVHVREVYGRGEKADRARPLATAYQKNRVSHVGTFPDLEDTLTTWEPTPGARSPDRLDATVYGVIELLGLSVNTPDPKTSHRGFDAAARAVNAPARGPASDLSTLLGGVGRGGSGRI